MEIFQTGNHRSVTKTKRNFVVKIVKGITALLVLCVVGIGAFVYFSPPPDPTLSEAQIDFLIEQGFIDANSDGQASATGVCAIFGDTGMDFDFGSTSAGAASSAPPSFLGGGQASSLPPVIAAAVPRVAVAGDGMAPSADFYAPTVLPPPNFVEPVVPFDKTPPVQPPVFEAPVFEAPSIGAPPATEAPPPPIVGGWDGPASTISALPPAETLQSPNFSPIIATPVVTPIAQTLPQFNNTIEITSQQITSPQADFHRVGETVRRVGEYPPAQSSPPQNWAPQNAATQDNNQNLVFSSSASSPIPPASARYTQTSIRQPLAFEPVRPEASPNAPVIAFGPSHHHAQPHHAPPMQQPAVDVPPASPMQQIAAHHPPVTTHIAQQPATPPQVSEGVMRFIQEQQHAASGSPDGIRHAFIQLSQAYEHPQLSEAERMLMQPILDNLAGKVIYSREVHVLESPHQVQPGETIESIARNFDLTPALLRRINGLAPLQQPAPGTMLKVFYGWFDAKISIQRREMTLLLGGLYAGRIAFAPSNPEIQTHRGEFAVTQKTDRMIALTNGWTLGTAGNATIIFSDQHAGFVFDILCEKSVIVVE